MIPRRRRSGPAAVAGFLLLSALAAGCAGQSAYQSASAPGLIDCSAHFNTIASCTDVARMAFLPGR